MKQITLTLILIILSSLIQRSEETIKLKLSKDWVAYQIIYRAPMMRTTWFVKIDSLNYDTLRISLDGKYTRSIRSRIRKSFKGIIKINSDSTDLEMEPLSFDSKGWTIQKLTKDSLSLSQGWGKEGEIVTYNYIQLK